MKVFRFAAILVCLIGARGFAQIELNGVIESQYGMRLSDPFDFNRLNSTLGLKLTAALGEHTSARADMNLKHTLDHLADAGALGIDLGEIYADLSLGVFDFRLGKQTVSWGTADAMAPTDTINPVDYTEFDILEFSTMKIPIPMLKVDGYLLDDYLHIELIYVPCFHPSIYPDADSDWAFYQPPLPQTMEIMGVPLTVVPDIQDPVYPARTPRNSEVGTRVGSSVYGFDFSAVYSYTWDDNPTMHRQVTPDPAAGTVTLTLTPEYHRIHMVGLDLATAIAELGLRGEGAFFITEDPNGENDEIEDPKLRWAIGADYTFLGALTATLQFSQEIRNLNFTTVDAVATASSLIASLSARLLEETLEVMASGIYDFEDRDYLLIAQVEYDFSDALSVQCGAQIFGGEEETLLGNYDDNDTVFLKAKYSF